MVTKFETTWIKGIRSEEMDSLGQKVNGHLNQMSAAGWELVNIVNLSKDSFMINGWGTTTDLMFIWKQLIDSKQLDTTSNKETTTAPVRDNKHPVDRFIWKE